MSAQRNKSGLTDAEEKAIKLGSVSAQPVQALHQKDGLYPAHVLSWIESYQAPPPSASRKSQRVKIAAKKKRADCLHGTYLQTYDALQLGSRPASGEVNFNGFEVGRWKNGRWKNGRWAKNWAREGKPPAWGIGMCRVVYKMTVLLVYKNISVSDNASQLVRTLATRPELAAMVQSLEFRHSATARIDYPEWVAALLALVNLRELVTDYYVPMKQETIPLIPFRLRSFTSFCAIIGTWANFLATQGELQELILHSDFMGAPPTPQNMPHLRVLKARYDDMAKFSAHAGLERVWFWLTRPSLGLPFSTRNLVLLSLWPARPSTLRLNGPQVLALLQMAPAILGGVKHLVLDEHRRLCPYTHGSGILRVALTIDNHRAPQLRVLTMVFSARESLYPNYPIVNVDMDAPRKPPAAPAYLSLLWRQWCPKAAFRACLSAFPSLPFRLSVNFPSGEHRQLANRAITPILPEQPAYLFYKKSHAVGVKENEILRRRIGALSAQIRVLED
ncbi:hypothetical protein B0H16DRAFT_1466320 [Mycena metata]|uniref:Uncharacterized protein n=1 Tax=Mycena metata TaxID=1033252 RepID=A0AAD7I986_9AGAR|nr:hypothetical protein B0H16DRAFT_1466320 [Mycena metata]